MFETSLWQRNLSFSFKMVHSICRSNTTKTKQSAFGLASIIQACQPHTEQQEKSFSLPYDFDASGFSMITSNLCNTTIWTCTIMVICGVGWMRLGTIASCQVSVPPPNGNVGNKNATMTHLKFRIFRNISILWRIWLKHQQQRQYRRWQDRSLYMMTMIKRSTFLHGWASEDANNRIYWINGML